MQSDSNNNREPNSFEELPFVIAEAPPIVEETWQRELREAVQNGRFIVTRTELTDASQDHLANWLDRQLPKQVVSHETRDRLISDILFLLYRVSERSPVDRFKLRIFTEEPCRRCSFHMDTVRPGAPVWGGLKVYNGEGVRWVSPTDIISMKEFYQWLAARDEIVRKHVANPKHRDAQLATLDKRPVFLIKKAVVHTIEAGSAILFKHIPSNLLWRDHSNDLAWMHCSPMQGSRRLVVNISPDSIH